MLTLLLVMCVTVLGRESSWCCVLFSVGPESGILGVWNGAESNANHARLADGRFAVDPSLAYGHSKLDHRRAGRGRAAGSRSGLDRMYQVQSLSLPLLLCPCIHTHTHWRLAFCSLVTRCLSLSLSLLFSYNPSSPLITSPLLVSPTSLTQQERRRRTIEDFARSRDSLGATQASTGANQVRGVDSVEAGSSDDSDDYEMIEPFNKKAETSEYVPSIREAVKRSLYGKKVQYNTIVGQDKSLFRLGN